MEHYSIIFSTELISAGDFESAVRSVNKRLLSSTSRQCRPQLVHPGSVLASVIKPVQDAEECEQQQTCDWTEVTTVDTALQPLCVPVCEQGSENPSDLLVQRLHHLADHLPQIGVLAEVVWLYCEEILPNIEENIELYGALKRLLEWHNIKVTFLFLGSEVSNDTKDMAEPWVTMLRGQVSLVGDLDLENSETFWRGSINLVSSNIHKEISLQGFELRCDSQWCGKQETLESLLKLILTGESENGNKGSARIEENDGSATILSPRMEVVAQLDIQQIPLLYFTGQCCHLCVASESRLVDRSREFLSRLEDNKRLCYLVRLDTGTSWRLPECDKLYRDGRERLVRKTWQDLVQENMEHASNCPCLPELDGRLGAHYFLLYSHDTDPCGLTEYPPNKCCSYQTCTAHLLRGVHKMSGESVHAAVVTSLGDSQQNSLQDREAARAMACSLLGKLPCAMANTLQSVVSDLEAAQIHAVQQWIDERQSEKQSTEISATKLLDILRSVPHSCATELRKLCPRRRRVGRDSSTESKEESGVESFVISHLERLILDFQSNSENRFGRFKSNDSLAGLSPPVKGRVLTLNAAEFLKCFKSDGSGVRENLPEVKLKRSNGRKLTKLSSEEIRSTSWPECGSYHYHDMYYNHAEMEAVENKSQQLRSRLHMIETSTTCNSRQVNTPATILVSTEQGRGHSDSLEVEVTEPEVLDEARLTRSSVKRKAVEHANRDGSKKLYAARKNMAGTRSQDKVDTKGATGDGVAAEMGNEKRESRSQRHKKKLEEVVKQTLRKENINKDDPLYKSCALRLYNVTKSFVKDLTSYQSLRQEMERIAQSNVKMVVGFEKDRQARAKAK